MFPTQALATAVATAVAAKRSNAAEGAAKTNGAPSPSKISPREQGGVNNNDAASNTNTSTPPTKSPNSKEAKVGHGKYNLDKVVHGKYKHVSAYPLTQGYSLTDIGEPTANDILFGRGGGTNHHPGNKLYRVWVDAKKEEYSQSARLKKPSVSMGIVRDWRALDPPGRFLSQDAGTKLWNDVGDAKAREKTSQALREKPWGKNSGKKAANRGRTDEGVQEEEAAVQYDESPASMKSESKQQPEVTGKFNDGSLQLQQMIQKDIEEWWNKKRVVELKDTRKPEEKVLPKGNARRKSTAKTEQTAVVQTKTTNPPLPPQQQDVPKPKRFTLPKRSKKKKQISQQPTTQPNHSLKNIHPPNNKRKIDWEDDYCLEYAELVYRAAVRTAEEKGLVTREKKRKLQHKFYGEYWIEIATLFMSFRPSMLNEGGALWPN